MPTNHDETLEQRYAREQSEHLAEIAKRTPEEIAYMEQLLHNALAERDQMATKVADLELALFAENQKRHDVERQRDELLAALKSAKHMLERDYIDDAKMRVVEQCDDAIEAVKGGAE